MLMFPYHRYSFGLLKCNRILFVFNFNHGVAFGLYRKLGEVISNTRKRCHVASQQYPIILLAESLTRTGPCERDDVARLCTCRPCRRRASFTTIGMDNHIQNHFRLLCVKVRNRIGAHCHLACICGAFQRVSF